MYAQFDYELSDHVLRLKKIEHERARRARISLDRPKKKIKGWHPNRRLEIETTDLLSIAFAQSMA